MILAYYQTFIVKERESNHSSLLSLNFSWESSVLLTLNCNNSMVFIRIALLAPLLEPLRRANLKLGISKLEALYYAPVFKGDLRPHVGPMASSDLWLKLRIFRFFANHTRGTRTNKIPPWSLCAVRRFMQTPIHKWITHLMQLIAGRNKYSQFDPMPGKKWCRFLVSLCNHSNVKNVLCTN